MKRIMVMMMATMIAVAGMAQSGQFDKLDVRSQLQIPRYSSLANATAAGSKAGNTVYVYTGADSAVWVRSYDNTRWIKVSGGGSGGASYSAGNGIKIDGSTVRWADSIKAPTNIKLVDDAGATTGIFFNTVKTDGSFDASFSISNLYGGGVLSRYLTPARIYHTNLANTGFILAGYSYGGSSGNSTDQLLLNDSLRLFGNNGEASTFSTGTVSNKYNLLLRDKVTGAIVNGAYSLAGSGGGTWGSITGTLSSQTDLQSALNAKQNSLSGTGFVKSTAGTISYDTRTYADSIRFVNSGILHTTPAAFAMSGNTAVITQTLATQSANTFFGNFTNSSATPTFAANPAVSVASATLAGAAGAGFIGYIAQSTTPSTPANGFRLYADATNRLTWVGANGYTRTFDGVANTANRVYTLPNATGRIALSSSATTGTTINFNVPLVYNTVASPATTNFLDDLSTANIGVIQKVYHNNSVAPSFPAGWVRIGAGDYVPSVLNIIYCEWISGTRVEYWINQ